MAAPWVSAVRSVFKGANHVVARGMLAAHTPAVCRCVRVHVPSAALRRSSSAGKQPRDKAAEEPEEPEEPEGPEYIPRRKAKNPMRNIGYAWMIGLPTGIITFLLVKRQVDKDRLKQLKIRQRMKMSNEGDYEGSRAHHHAQAVKVDT